MDGWFDSPIETFKAKVQAAIDDWNSALASLDTEQQTFQDNLDYANNNPDFATRASTLNDKFSAVQGTLNTVSNALQSIRDFFNSSGQAPPSGLGFAFVIPWAVVAVIVAATAFIWGIVYEARQFNVDVQNAKITDYNIANPNNPLAYPPVPVTGPFAGLSDTAKWITYGVLGYLALQIFESRR